MQGRPEGRAGGGAGVRRRTARNVERGRFTARNVERGRRTVRPGDEAAATWAAGVGVGTGALESAAAGGAGVGLEMKWRKKNRGSSYIGRA